MVQTVNIRKGEKVIRVYFMYNVDLIDIMREHNGWWFRKEKCWQFPISKLESLYDHLTKEKYNVNITKLEESKNKPQQTQIKINPWTKDTVSVYGKNKCKKCKQVHFLDRQGLCPRCR